MNDALAAVKPQAKHNAHTTATAKINTGQRTVTAEPVAVELSLSEIHVDEKFQCRTEVNERTVADYAERMLEKDVFPPVVVFDVDGKYILADGFHRFRAAEKAKRQTIAAVTMQGSARDALLFGIRANVSHSSLRFNNRDKRRAVELVLRADATMSDRALAELCRVSHTYVAGIRAELATVATSKSRTGRDGKQYPARPKRAKPMPAADATKPAEKSASANAAAANDAQPETDSRSDDPAPEGSDSAGEHEPEPITPVRGIYDIKIEWKRIEKFLLAEVAKCPRSQLGILSAHLCNFTDRIY